MARDADIQMDTTMMRCVPCGWGVRIWTVEEAMYQYRKHRDEHRACVICREPASRHGHTGREAKTHAYEPPIEAAGGGDSDGD